MSNDTNTRANIFLSKIIYSKKFDKVSKIEINVTLSFHKPSNTMKKQFHFSGNTLKTAVILTRFSLLAYYTEYNQTTTSKLGMRILDVINLYFNNHYQLNCKTPNVSLTIIKINLINEKNAIIDVIF